MFDLSDKGALVTGATGGIGAVVAETLHAQGATVAISGTRAERLAELAEKLGDRVHILPCDLADREAVAQLAKDAEAALGHLDVLVNNAGVTKDNLLMLLKNDDWDRVININLTSSFTLIRGALRNMMKRRYGRIVNITSISGIIGNPGQANYAASKAGMIGMTKSLAREVATRGVTANCISPGFIKTAMTEALKDDQAEAIAQHIPAGFFGEPSDIASAVVYLASEEARYVTGQTLHVNGGMVMI
ncbi:MAG: 3-oxoacyl-[acyl-carrier-protein] reductase [Hyphomicrobiaceae bacterium]